MYGLSPDPPPRRPSRYRTALIAVAALTVGVGATLAVVEFTGRQGTKPVADAKPAASPTPTTVAMSGHIAMRRYDKGQDPAFRVANWTTTSSGGCEGHGGYDDMTEGADVTVYDANGQVIGASSLEGGQRAGSRCRWAFTVEGVTVSPFYQVEVSHRGKVTVQKDDVGVVELTLGS